MHEQGRRSISVVLPLLGSMRKTQDTVRATQLLLDLPETPTGRAHLEEEKVMSNCIQEPESFIPLTELAFQIFMALGTGATHGYGIGEEIGEQTSGRLNPTSGSLCQILTELSEAGLIQGADSGVDNHDAHLNYFRLTALGRQVMALEVERMAELVSVARERLLPPKRL